MFNLTTNSMFEFFIYFINYTSVFYNRISGQDISRPFGCSIFKVCTIVNDHECQTPMESDNHTNKPGQWTQFS